MTRIKSLIPEERPREKLEKHGAKTLTNTDLLAIILQSGSKTKSALEISRNLLKENNLKSLSRRRMNYLKGTKGIGTAKACKIMACFELGKRLAAFNEKEGPSIRNAESIAKKFIPEMSSLKKEHFKCVFLNSRMNVINEETIFIGSLDTSVIHPREIFHPALEENAAAIILIHNHPSGNPNPSEEDIEITLQLIKAGNIMGVEVLDHIIIANNKYFSMKEEKTLF